MVTKHAVHEAVAISDLEVLRKASLQRHQAVVHQLFAHTALLKHSWGHAWCWCIHLHTRHLGQGMRASTAPLERPTPMAPNGTRCRRCWLCTGQHRMAMWRCSRALQHERQSQTHRVKPTSPRTQRKGLDNSQCNARLTAETLWQFEVINKTSPESGTPLETLSRRQQSPSEAPI